MKISRIAFENFRIYKGNNEIIFGKNIYDKNINIIAGQNGFGKTTFLLGVIWGFYGKLLGEVDDKYKREIYESGGYKKFVSSLINRNVFSDPDAQKTFCVEIELIDLLIPSVPCSNLIIRRAYDVEKEKETVSILIDGSENELAKEVGQDIFINDFILPREIAKFFLFDSEKIVELAEIKTLNDKRRLSLAFSEVLGINKYENLKKQLESLRIKLRRTSANDMNKNKLEKLTFEADQIEEYISLNEDRITAISSEIEKNKVLSEQYQEKLIREGNNLTVEELINKKKEREQLREKSNELKSKLKELLEIVPFVIAGKKLLELKTQVEAETHVKKKLYDVKIFSEKIKEGRRKYEELMYSKDISNDLRQDIFNIFDQVFNVELYNEPQIDILINLSDDETLEFDALYNYILNSFKELFSNIVKSEKENRILLSRLSKIIIDSEARDNDAIAKKYKQEKSKIDSKIIQLNKEQNRLYSELGAFKQELNVKKKQISELTSRVRLDDIDLQKDIVTERLINELNGFVLKFKLERKNSLQMRMKVELHKLLHKKNFIQDVNVELSNDIIDINLIDRNGNHIEKETLSKGEQQLYATALLKSLVEESGIQFPILIDSPLQKFDKNHSLNIIHEFYPSISHQVILFPLLEKELSKKEYSVLSEYINQTFIIESKNDSSTIRECMPEELFEKFELTSNV